MRILVLVLVVAVMVLSSCAMQTELTMKQDLEQCVNRVDTKLCLESKAWNPVQVFVAMQDHAADKEIDWEQLVAMGDR